MPSLQSDFFIPVLLGTGRQGRLSEQAALFVLEQAKEYGLATELVDVRDYTSPVTVPWWVENAKAKPWSEIMHKADGLIIVTPEYNHGYPGELKIMLDSIYEEYEGKPVAICGVSSGGFGGAKGVEHLKHVLLKYMMFPLRTGVFFANVQSLFDASGQITDGSYAGKVEKMLDELVTYARKLKS